MSSPKSVVKATILKSSDQHEQIAEKKKVKRSSIDSENTGAKDNDSDSIIDQFASEADANRVKAYFSEALAQATSAQTAEDKLSRESCSSVVEQITRMIATEKLTIAPEVLTIK